MGLAPGKNWAIVLIFYFTIFPARSILVPEVPIGSTASFSATGAGALGCSIASCFLRFWDAFGRLVPHRCKIICGSIAGDEVQSFAGCECKQEEFCISNVYV